MLTRISSVALACVVAGALWAQTDTEAASEDNAASDAAAGADVVATEESSSSEGSDTGTVAGLSTGEATGPAVGEAYTKNVSGDWEVRCVRLENPENDPCQLYQLLKDTSGNAVSEISVFRLPEGGEVIAGATVIVPLETLLTAQLTITIDGANARRYPFSFCTQAGCYARLGLTQADVNAFKRGAKAEVSIRPFAAPDRVVAVDMSLTGFTAGFDEATVVEDQ